LPTLIRRSICCAVRGGVLRVAIAESHNKSRPQVPANGNKCRLWS
jgi:hypothetical protein